MKERYENLIQLFPIGEEYIFNDDGFKEAIKNACHDMTRRTMKLKQDQVSVTDQMLMESLCKDNLCKDNDSFFKMLKAYFESPQKDRDTAFNEWHKNACKEVMTVLNNYYQPESVTYGKAQKVVNITMKWICCLKGAEDKYNDGYFDHCHIALDSFTLEWIYRKGSGKKYEETDNKKIVRDNFTSWSNLSNDIEDRKYKNENKILTYQEIQNIAKKICQQEDIGMTPFEAEFYVWKQMQLTLAAEALYDGENKKDFKNLILKDKKEPLIECMKNIEFDKYLI